MTPKNKSYAKFAVAKEEFLVAQDKRIADMKRLGESRDAYCNIVKLPCSNMETFKIEDCKICSNPCEVPDNKIAFNGGEE